MPWEQPKKWQKRQKKKKSHTHKEISQHEWEFAEIANIRKLAKTLQIKPVICIIYRGLFTVYKEIKIISTVWLKTKSIENNVAGLEKKQNM